MAPRNRKLRVKERRYRTRCPATLLLLANRTPNRGTTINRIGISCISFTERFRPGWWAGVSKKGNSAKSCNFRAVIAFSGQRSFQLSGEGCGWIAFQVKGHFNCPARGCGWIAFQVKGHFNCPARGAGELLFRSKVISIVRRGGAGELLFRSKVISIVQRGGAGELLSGQRSKSGGKMLDCLFRCWSLNGCFGAPVSSKSKPIKEAGFRKKLSFGKYSPRV